MVLPQNAGYAHAMPFTPPAWTAGDRARRQREELGLTVRDLAERSGLNKGTIVAVENNAPTTSARTWARLAEALDAPESWLREGTLP